MNPPWKALAAGLAAVLLILFVGYACGWSLP
jgi:hypothetical protein